MRQITSDDGVYFNVDDIVKAIEKHKDAVCSVNPRASSINKVYSMAHDHIIELINWEKMVALREDLKGLKEGDNP